MNFRRSIYNHCRVMAAWSRKTLKKIDFLSFLKNDPLRENFWNSVPKVFIASPIDVVCSNFVKFRRQEIGKVARYLPEQKKFAWLSSSRYCTDCAQNVPDPSAYWECCRFHPNRFTFVGVISERVNTVRAHAKVNPIFGWSLASSRIIDALSMRFCKH